MISISVIIPVYNSEEYIARAIESACAQTITQIEIICVDDGSTDRSVEIIKSYQKSDARIIYIYQENNGPGAARNTGLSYATGEYIAFLDSDDEYPDIYALELLYSRAKRQDAYLCGGSVCGNWNATLNDLPQFTEGIYHFVDYQNDFMFWRYIYLREFLAENGIKFPTYRDYEDPVFLLEVLDKAKSFYAVEECVYKKNAGHLTQGKKSLLHVKHRLLGCETNLRLALAKNYHIIYYRNVIAMSKLASRIIELIYDDEADEELISCLLRGITLIKVRKLPNQYRKDILRRLRILTYHLLKNSRNHFFVLSYMFLKIEIVYDLLRISEVFTK